MNPFSSRFIRPGARNYIFAVNESIDTVLKRLNENRLVQIVGPHGSGKSTLVEMIGQLIQCKVSKIVIPSVQDRNETFKVVKATIDSCSADQLIMIDGIEQLTASQQKNIFDRCRKRNLLLLVTTHQPVGIETLITTEPSFVVFQQIVADMLDGQPNSGSANSGWIEQADIENAYENHAPDLREAFFELYDVYERRRSKD